MKNEHKRIALLIPVYNGKSSVMEVLRRCKPLNLNVIVIDDGSTDGTSELVEQAGVDHFLRHPKNQGKGQSLQDGFRLAQDLGYEAVISLDADGQHQPEEAVKFLECYEQNCAEIIVGNRFGDKEYLRRMPFLRVLSNRFSSFLLRRFGRLEVQDIQCGYRLYQVTPALQLSCHSQGFEFETEVLLRAVSRGYQLKNVPIQCEYPEGTVRSQYRAFFDSWKIYCIARSIIKSRKREDN